MTLKRATLAEQAYEELRTRIVTGELPGGRRLLADELAQEMAISPTPVKEALTLLERDGLVEISPRRGSVVRRFQALDVRHIFEARTMLEVHALRHGWEAGAITPAFVARLGAVFARQVAHAQQNRPVPFAGAVRLDREFHETLIELAGNPVVVEWHRDMLRQTMTILTYSMETYDAERAHTEHAAIVAALESGDSARMEASMVAHLVASRDATLTRIPALNQNAA